MDLGLDGRVALVTGGSKGIGLAVARQLADEGSEPVLVARTESELAAAAESIAARTGRMPRFATADVGDDASVAALAEQVGPVQILVSRAIIAGSARSPSYRGGRP
jgi:NAD(P)-dependent dehydrogenase (short-subunit alcohol dehydrogenase family)